VVSQRRESTKATHHGKACSSRWLRSPCRELQIPHFTTSRVARETVRGSGTQHALLRERSTTIRRCPSNQLVLTPLSAGITKRYPEHPPDSTTITQRPVVSSPLVMRIMTSTNVDLSTFQFSAWIEHHDVHRLGPSPSPPLGLTQVRQIASISRNVASDL
jgi:hypothetical protein